MKKTSLILHGWPTVLLAGGTIVSAILLLNSHPQQISNDAIQYVVMAEHLLAGHGVRTDIVYYDVQYALGAQPVPQTVFPAGFPLLIALLMSIGASPAFAVAAASAIGFVVLPVMVFGILAVSGVDRFTAGIAGLVQLASVLTWQSIPFGLSEPVFTAITLIALFMLTRFDAECSWRRVIATGAVAALSVYFRYQGLLFVFGLGVGLSVWTLLQPSWRRAQQVIVYGVTAALVVLPLLARNLYLAGHIGGGGVRSVDYPEVSRSLERLLWVFSDITGISGTGLRTGQLAEVLFIVATLGCVVVVMRRRKLPLPTSGDRFSALSSPVFCAAVGYILSTVVILAVRAISNSDHILTSRYFSVLVPFALVAVMIGLRSLRIDLRPRTLDGGAVFVVACLALLAGQKNVFEYRWAVIQERADRHDSVYIPLHREMADGSSLRDRLAADIDAGRNVLAFQAQLTRSAVGRPVFGIPDRLMSNNVISPDNVGCLAEERDIANIITFPTLFDAENPANDNRMIFDPAVEIWLPSWIRVEHADDDVVLLMILETPDRCDLPIDWKQTVSRE